MQTSNECTIVNTMADIRGTWGILFGSLPVPTDGQIARWILQHGTDAVRSAVARAGRKYESLGGHMTAEHIGRYISAILSR